MTSEDLPRRKKIRLEGYDHSANGLYFVTICVTKKYQVLWENVGANSVRPLTANEILHPKLSVTGKLVKRKLTEISEHYPDVFVEMSCIMPDHVHIIIKIEKQPKNGRTLFAPTSETPTLSRVIKHFKEAVTKELGYSIWQKSFYDTIIKNRKQHAEIRQYIANNPAKYVKIAFDEQDMK